MYILVHATYQRKPRRVAESEQNTPARTAGGMTRETPEDKGRPKPLWRKGKCYKGHGCGNEYPNPVVNAKGGNTHTRARAWQGQEHRPNTPQSSMCVSKQNSAK